MSQKPVGVADRLDMVTADLKQRGQAREGLEIPRTEPLALAEEPLVVAPVEEVARVQIDGFPQCDDTVIRSVLRPRDRLGEGSDVQPDGRV